MVALEYELSMSACGGFPQGGGAMPGVAWGGLGAARGGLGCPGYFRLARTPLEKSFRRAKPSPPAVRTHRWIAVTGIVRFPGDPVRRSRRRVTMTDRRTTAHWQADLALAQLTARATPGPPPRPRLE